MKMQDKVIMNGKRHLKNIKILSEREPSKEELKEMYSYLNYCVVCGKEFTFWDRISFNMIHGFEGNAHRRDC